MLQWVAEHDAVLRGIVHGLSNRVGTIGAVAGMLLPGEAVPAAVTAVLQEEATRLERVLTLLRLLPLDRDAAPEPVHLPDLIAGVVELHAHNSALHDVPCTVGADPDALPVYAPHSALAHALLVLLAAGARGGEDAGGEARLRWTGDAERVVVTVDAAAGAAAAAAWLLGDAATVRADADGAASIILPTLAAARQRA